jgi:hypothetical protein
MSDEKTSTPSGTRSIAARPRSTPRNGHSSRKERFQASESTNRMDSVKDPAVMHWADDRFPAGTRQRQDFDALCAAGCDRKLLLSFLTIAATQVEWQRTIYDVYGTTRPSLDKLPAVLDKLSTDLELINPLISGFLESTLAQNHNLPDQVRSGARRQAAVYRVAPKLLQYLARDIRAASAWVNDNIGPKRYDTLRGSVCELVWYVEVSTGSPQYEQVSELLEHVSLNKTLQKVAGDLARFRGGSTYKRKKSALPKFLTSPDALKALYLRSATYGFRNTDSVPNPR